MTASPLHIITGQLTRDAPLDTAVSRAILQQVSDGHLPETIQIGRPSRVVAFGKHDALSPTFFDAVSLAREKGFTPTVRIAGGRAVVFHEHTIRFTWTTPTQNPVKEIKQRFATVAQHVVQTLTFFGAEAVIGEVPGEYCPGKYSVHVLRSGRAPERTAVKVPSIKVPSIKVMGSGQRLARAASQVSGMVVVKDSESVNRVLVPIYEVLELEMDPLLTGSVADVVEVDTDALGARLAHEMASGREILQATIEPHTLRIAKNLRADHDPQARV